MKSDFVYFIIDTTFYNANKDIIVLNEDIFCFLHENPNSTFQNSLLKVSPDEMIFDISKT